jgi:hypothetical protein
MGRPVTRAEDWQQGFGIIYYEPEGAMRFHYESIAVWSGWARFRDKEYTA